MCTRRNRIADDNSARLIPLRRRHNSVDFFLFFFYFIHSNRIAIGSITGAFRCRRDVRRENNPVVVFLFLSFLRFPLHVYFHLYLRTEIALLDKILRARPRCVGTRVNRIRLIYQTSRLSASSAISLLLDRK